MKRLCFAASILMFICFSGSLVTVAQTSKGLQTKVAGINVAVKQAGDSNSSVQIFGQVHNCMNDPLTAIKVVLRDSNDKIIAQTLTDFRGMYSFTASRPSEFGLQIIIDDDSSQIVGKVRVNPKTNSANVDFMAFNLPEGILFNMMSELSMQHMQPEAKETRKAMIRRINGNSELIAGTIAGSKVSIGQQPLISSINKGVHGVYFKVMPVSRPHESENSGAMPDHNAQDRPQHGFMPTEVVPSNNIR